MTKKRTKSQTGRMAKIKGAVGEREVSNLLKEWGFEARRGQQFSGGGDSPDVVHSLSIADDCDVHIEVKRVEKLGLWAALDQAEEDAAPGDMPVVFHRKNKKPWVVVLLATDFLTIMQELEKHVKENWPT